eukprot:CAMPEP_0182428814 /NCGR_PEP_ID=MMETSP1167-20130531/23819_1 /TAXON_ID=2988 /ORGANISM="Mallomonas Sp, Strain CCMP3275" /LENGTH=476 /DNA_ID=CAMNT_0024611935 /DNA_START=56 /DNA_END=1486 /DNA_ORIENTATION=+
MASEEIMDIEKPAEEVDMEEEEEDDVLKKSFDTIEEIESENPTNAIIQYQEILKNERSDDLATKLKEQCIYKLTRLHTEASRFDDVIGLLNKNGSFFESIPKAKTAKIVRSVIEIVATIPDSLDIQIRLCQDVIEWCKQEKRTFLRQRIEGKLAALLLQKNQLAEALALITTLLRELKKLDDKQMLTEAHLTESRVQHALQNIPKAKAALTACRTTANVIYVTPLLQAELDEMSGILLCEEGDNLTAYSYFLEAFEAYDQGADRRAIRCLQYMCLCKVLQESPGEVASIISARTTSRVLSNKSGARKETPSTMRGMSGGGEREREKEKDGMIEMQAMIAVASAAKERSLEDFQTAVNTYSKQLQADTLIKHHLDLLYEKMMQTNLLKIIQPFSCVEVSRVAELINLPLPQVEKKLSQMILDGHFSGTLDQGKGHLIVYNSIYDDPAFTHGLEIISSLGVVVEALSQRAKNLSKSIH